MFKAALCRIHILATLVLLAFIPNEAARASEAVVQPVQSEVYDDATLARFVAAAKEVVALRREYEPALRSAPNQEMAEALTEEARNKMTAAITGTGMTMEGYLQIAEAAQTDPVLRERISTLLNE